MTPFVEGFSVELTKIAKSDRRPSIGRGAALGALGGGVAGLAAGAPYARTAQAAIQGSRNPRDLAAREVMAILGPALLAGGIGGGAGAGLGAGVQGVRRAMHPGGRKKHAGLFGKAPPASLMSRIPGKAKMLGAGAAGVGAYALGKKKGVRKGEEGAVHGVQAAYEMGARDMAEQFMQQLGGDQE